MGTELVRSPSIGPLAAVFSECQKVAISQAEFKLVVGFLASVPGVAFLAIFGE